MSHRLRCLALAALWTAAGTAASPALAQTVSCTGVAAYSPSTIYSAGGRAVYNAKLYQANIAIWNTPPDYCPACNWWTLLGTCGGGSSDTTAPGVPTGLATTGQTTNSISLRWNASADNSGGSGVKDYDLLRNGSVVATTAALSATDAGLTANTTYSYAVRARDNANNVSASSGTLSVTTTASGSCTVIPSVPSGLSSPSQTSSSVSLSWNASSSGPNCTVQYRVFQNGSQVVQVAGTSATIGGLLANTAYSFSVGSIDQAGSSGLSAAISVRTATTTPPGGNLPKHVITGYWQNFNNGARVLRLRDVPTAYNLVAVAFADATGTPGAVTFNLDPGLSSALGGYTQSEFIADINTLHGQGRKVILSVGGQNGTVSVTNTTAATNFSNSVRGLMTQYGFDGVDIDLENGVNAQFMGQALRAIAAGRSGTVITMAPQTIDMQSTQTEYFKLALGIKDILTIVNMQYYNSGSMLGCDGQVYSQGSVNFLTALTCIELQGGLRPDQVGLGLPASTSGAGSGFVNPSVVNAALDCLAAGTNCGSFRPPARWPGIRGAMTWSINWDASNGYNWVNTINSHLPAVP